MRRALLAAFAAVSVAASAAAPRLTESEARGKAIFFHGRSDAPLTARIGEENLEVAASVVPCASCHGYDGRGRRESGVAPPSVRWDDLITPYAVGERRHPPYTASSLKRAVAMGVDPAGNRLQSVMPRYQLSQRDMSDLIAYLRKLPADADPGLTDSAIRIAVVLLPGERAEPVRKVVESYFAKLNESGGVFNRRIDVAFGATTAELDRLGPFAILAPTLIGSADGFEAYAADHEIPLIAAIAVTPPRSRSSFHLLPGLNEQAATLFEAFPDAAVVYKDAPPFRDAALALHASTLLTDPAKAAARKAVVVIGPASLQREVLRIASAMEPPPAVLIPGVLSVIDPAEIPEKVRPFVRTAVPLLPSDVQPAAFEELRALGVTQTSPTLIGALATSKIAVETLRRAGHDLTREKLIETLETLYETDTALMPRITFSEARHVGIVKAHVQ